MKLTKFRPPGRPGLATATSIALLALAMLLLPGCGKKEKAGEGGRRRAAKAKAGEPLRIRIQNPADQEVATFVLRPKLVRVEYTESGSPRLLESKLNGTTRRYGDGNSVLAEAATTDNQIRVRAADGTLWWTMVLKDGRVRLNPPGEGAEPFWLVKVDDTRMRISRGETTVGRVTLDGAKKRVKIRDGFGNVLFDAPSHQVEPWFGVLTLPDMPIVQRYILMMELLTQKR